MTWTVKDFATILELLDMSETQGVSVYFQVHKDTETLSVYVDCSDLFYWGTADAEKIEMDDVPDLRQAMADLGEHGYWAGQLFCARRRGMRPQGPWYGYTGPDGRIRRSFVPRAVEALFDACGPEREDSRKEERPADGRRWEYGGPAYSGPVPPEFLENFKEGGQFGP